jgi:predicted metal-dependent hydrolase
MTSENKKPVIVGFVADLMFNVRIERVVQQLGYQIRWIEQADDLAPASAESQEERPGELLHGQGGALFTSLAEWQPALLIFDLNNEAVPWREWIASIKSSPATRRIPVLAFGSHVETEAIAAARAAGADQVVARSRFSSAMPQLIDTHALKRDQSALDETCSQPLSDLARKGIEMFNEGHFYKCHDFLEEAWVEDESPGRDLYRGILQVGIAYYQIERGNYRGALKMLLRVRQWLDPLPDVCRGVDVARLREDVQNVHNRLLELGEDQMDEIDRSLFRQVRLV